MGRARPRTAQNPAARLGEDEMDMAVSDDDEDAADVAGPSGLHGEAHHHKPCLRMERRQKMNAASFQEASRTSPVQSKARAEMSAMKILSHTIICIRVVVMQLRKSYLQCSRRLSMPDQQTGGQAGQAGQKDAGPRRPPAFFIIQQCP